jgi:uncharacterized protein
MDQKTKREEARSGEGIEGASIGARANATLYLLLLLCTLPLVILAQVVKRVLLPGLPLSGLSFCVPTLATIVFLLATRRKDLIAAILGFLLKVDRPGQIGTIAFASLLMPLILAASFALDILSGRNIYAQPIHIGSAALLLPVFLIAAFGEEFLWTGFFLRQFRAKFDLKPTLCIATAYILWHALPFFQTGKSIQWILGQMAFSFLFRILIVQFYFLCGRLGLAAILLHATYNLAWQLYPDSGSFYNPGLTASVTLMVVLLFAALSLKRPASSR